MLPKKGMTFIEIIAVITIIGISIAFFLPNFTQPTELARARNARNNLLAIYSAEQNQNTSNQAFAYPLADISTIDNSLSMDIMDDGMYTYSCASDASGFKCTATRTDNNLNMTVINAPINGTNPSCTAAAGDSGWCP